MFYREDNITKEIETAIKGEYNAIICYEQIANMSADDHEKQQILEIRNDEIQHYHTFSSLYTQLTGKKPSPQITEDCPKNYRKALEFALIDEQKTVDFYLEIADKTQNPFIKEHFKRAAADEQNHAVWFLYYLTKQKM
jgi:rubrerythrin